MSKLITHGCCMHRGGAPQRHHSFTNMKKGYPKEHRGKFDKILKRLERDGLVYIFPHSGENHVSAIIDKDVIVRTLEVANRFRSAEKLPQWNREFKEDLETL